MRYGNIGSLSHGTMRPEDLIPCFADEIRDLLNKNAAHLCSDEGRTMRDRLVALCDDADAIDLEDEPFDDNGIVTELADALSEFAPPYCYFGAHEGDGSDYGFWPCMEQIQELPVVESGDDAKALGEDAVFINDHGNVTVFGGDGSVIFDMV